MKNRRAILLGLTFLISGAISVAQDLKLDITKSNVEWTGRKVAGAHNGKISFASGTLTQSGSTYTAGELVVDMKSIICTDISDPGTNAQLVGHLKSDDFFGVDAFPTAKLVVKKGNPKGNNLFEFTGDITIKGVTQPVKFDATLLPGATGVSFSGKLVIDRSKFNIRYGSGSFFQNLGDNLIYDDFSLDFNTIFTTK